MTNLSGAESTLFFFLAPLAVLGGLGLIFARKAVHAAVGMALTMVSLGIFYIAQQAEFLGIIQIFVYSGAVVMMFLFVVMLVGVDSSDSLVETIKGQRPAGILLGLAMASIGVVTVAKAEVGPFAGLTEARKDGEITALALRIFGEYIWVFEVTAALLIVASIGAMVLAHRERLTPKRSQAEWSKARIKSGEDVVGLPAPGVFARHNSVETPALLPDGSVADKSILRVIKARGQVTEGDPELEHSRELEREAGDITHKRSGDDR